MEDESSSAGAPPEFVRRPGVPPASLAPPQKHRASPCAVKNHQESSSSAVAPPNRRDRPDFTVHFDTRDKKFLLYKNMVDAIRKKAGEIHRIRLVDGIGKILVNLHYKGNRAKIKKEEWVAYCRRTSLVIRDPGAYRLGFNLLEPVQIDGEPSLEVEVLFQEGRGYVPLGEQFPPSPPSDPDGRLAKARNESLARAPEHVQKEVREYQAKVRERKARQRAQEHEDWERRERRRQARAQLPPLDTVTATTTGQEPGTSEGASGQPEPGSSTGN